MAVAAAAAAAALVPVVFADAGVHGAQPGIANVNAITMAEVLNVEQYLEHVTVLQAAAAATVSHAELQQYRVFAKTISEQRIIQQLGVVVAAAVVPAVAAAVVPAVAAAVGSMVAPFQRALTRSHNQQIFMMAPGSDLMSVPNLAGAFPANFPQTPELLDAMPGAAVDALLGHYGIAPAGGVAARRRQLCRELGDKRRYSCRTRKNNSYIRVVKP